MLDEQFWKLKSPCAHTDDQSNADVLILPKCFWLVWGFFSDTVTSLPGKASAARSVSGQTVDLFKLKSI